MASSNNLQGYDAPNDEEGEREEVGDAEGEAEEYAEDTAPDGHVLAVSTSTIYLRAQNICLFFMPPRMCLSAMIDERPLRQLCTVVDIVMVRPNALNVKSCAPEASSKNKEPRACNSDSSVRLASRSPARSAEHCVRGLCFIRLVPSQLSRAFVLLLRGARLIVGAYH